MLNNFIEKDVVIIGGGISGLATAYRLQKAGSNILLLEKSSRIGGAIQTEQVDGFLFDKGPNSTLETSNKVSRFIEEIGLGAERVYANPEAKRRYILKNGQLIPLPMNPSQFIKTKLFSAKAKLRLLAEPFVGSADPSKEESVAEFVERRIGSEFLNYAMNPFIAGVYAGDPKRLSMRSAVTKVYDLEKNFGSLIIGAIKSARKRKKSSSNPKFKARLFSFEHGMAELPNTLEGYLRNCLQKNVTIEKIQPDTNSKNSYSIFYQESGRLNKVRTKSLIFTTPAFVTANLLQSFDASFAKTLNEISYAPVAVVFFGFKENLPGRPLDGFGFLVPDVEKRQILGTVWNTTIFHKRAPNNGISLTTFIGGSRQPEVLENDDDALVGIVREEFKEILHMNVKPDIISVKRWEKAIPQYQIGHQDRIEKIESWENRYPGIFINGNFRGGISVADCILNSESIAEKIIDYCNDYDFLEKKPVESIA